MLWETPLIQTMLDSPSHPSEYEGHVPKQGRASTAPRRRRAVSTSLPLKTLCTFNPDYYSLYSNLDSIFHYLPTTPRLFGAEDTQQQHSRLSVHHRSQPQSHLQTPSPSSSPISSSQAPTNGGVVNTLPPELLCLIFESYLEPSSSSSTPTLDSGVPEVDPCPHRTSSPHGFFSVSREYIRTPVPLTHVCRSWRHAAIAHRRLWSSIAFALADGREEDEEEAEWDDNHEDFELFARGKIQLMRLFLRRARDTPLSISFSASVKTPTSSWSFNRDFGLVHEALKLICRYSRTWKDLTVELDQVWGVETFLEMLVRSPAAVSPSCGFEKLQSLHLELAVEDGEDEEMFGSPGLGLTATTQNLAIRAAHSMLTVKDIYRVLLRHSPNLTDITLDDTFFLCAEDSEYDACPSYQPRDPCQDDEEDFVPWAQLKNLNIHSDSISTCRLLGICSLASNLETLKVWRVGSNGSSEVDYDFEFDCAAHLPPSSISLPHLRSLDVTLLSEPEQLFAPLVLGPQLENVKVNVYALQSREHLMGFSPPRRSLLKEILEPVDRLLGAASSSSQHKIDVQCSVKQSCVDLDGTELDAARSACAASVDRQWLEENGLNALVGERRKVEVYKY